MLPLVLKRVSFDCLDDMYAAIGFGGLTAVKAVGRIRDELTKAAKATTPKELLNLNKQQPTVDASGVIVEDIGSCMIKFSRCCTPVPGDDIIGFITKGYGVSVHRKDCPNAKSAMDPSQSGRWVKVTWAESPEATFTTALEVDSNDRDVLMLDVATILTSLRLRMNEMVRPLGRKRKGACESGLSGAQSHGTAKRHARLPRHLGCERGPARGRIRWFYEGCCYAGQFRVCFD